MHALDLRLQMLFSLTPECECVADIGTDHGYLPLALYLEKKCRRGIACDISAPSLQKAVRHSREWGVPLDCRQGDGLLPLLPGEADCIIIAGMGGILIADILEQGKDILQPDTTLVLQPMTAVEELRDYLKNAGFCITAEDMVLQEDKLYHAFAARRGEWVEHVFSSHPLYPIYLKREIRQELEILQKMGGYRGVEYQKHLQRLQQMQEEERRYGQCQQ